MSSAEGFACWTRARGVLVHWSDPEPVLTGMEAAMASVRSPPQPVWRMSFASSPEPTTRRIGFELERATGRMVATNLTPRDATDWLRIERATRGAPVVQTAPVSSDRFQKHSGLGAERLLCPGDFAELFSVTEQASATPFRQMITLRWIDQARSSLEPPFPTAPGGDEFELELDTRFGYVHRLRKYVGRDLAECLELTELEIE